MFLCVCVCSLLDLLQFLDSSETVEAKCGHGAPRRVCLGLREAEEVSAVSGLLGGEGAACLSAVETFNFSSEAWTQFLLRVKEQFWGLWGGQLLPHGCVWLSTRPSVHLSTPGPCFFTTAMSVCFLDLRFPCFSFY